MTVSVTPETLAAVYDCLRAFPPFKGWKLPPSSQINFLVGKSRRTHGDYTKLRREPVHFIRLSDATIGHWTTLCRVMAHEMLHLHQELRGLTTPKTEHNAEFTRMGRLIARRFGWDEKAF